MRLHFLIWPFSSSTRASSHSLNYRRSFFKIIPLFRFHLLSNGSIRGLLALSVLVGSHQDNPTASATSAQVYLYTLVLKSWLSSAVKISFPYWRLLLRLIQVPMLEPNVLWCHVPFRSLIYWRCLKFSWFIWL